MSLIVEDGSIVPNANSYVALIDADNYFRARNNHVWLSLEQTAKEALLIAATDYIELRFGRRFLGQKKQDNQPLSFPRKGFLTLRQFRKFLKKRVLSTLSVQTTVRLFQTLSLTNPVWL